MSFMQEDFCKYFLYSLLDLGLTEIRFDSRPNSDEFNKIKFWKISAFLIDLPFELYKINEGIDKKSYSTLALEYESRSKNMNMFDWFESTRKTRLSFFSKKKSKNIK